MNSDTAAEQRDCDNYLDIQTGPLGGHGQPGPRSHLQPGTADQHQTSALLTATRSGLRQPGPDAVENICPRSYTADPAQLSLAAKRAAIKAEF